MATLASVYNNSKQYVKEITIHLQALYKFPNLEKQILSPLVKSYLNNNEIGKAEESALKLIKLDSDNYNSFELLVKVYSTTNKYKDAIKVLEDVIKKFPDNEEEALESIVSAYILLEDFDKAEEVAKSVLNKFPDSPNSLATLSSVYNNSKQYVKEITIHLQALYKFPNLEKQILSPLVKSYLNNNEIGKAEESALKLIKLDSDNYNSFELLVKVYSTSNKYKNAIKVLEDVIEKFPDKEEEVLLDLVNTFSELGDKVKVQYNIEKLLSKYPKKKYLELKKTLGK